MKAKIYLLMILIAFLQLKAQSLDPTFGTNGKKVFTGMGEITSMKIQNDGKVLFCGVLSDQAVIYRIDPDGTFDSSFGAGGKLTLDDPNYSFDALSYPVLQPDGKIVVVFFGSNTNGLDGFEKLIRINTNGTLDNTFVNSFGPYNDFYTQPIIQSDGKIIWGESSNGKIIRFTANGAIDPTFGSAGSVTLSNTNELVYIDYNPVNGDIIYTDYEGASNWRIGRINSSGVQQTGVNNFSDPNIYETKFYNNSFYVSGQCNDGESACIKKMGTDLCNTNSFGISSVASFTTTKYNNGFDFLNDGGSVLLNIDDESRNVSLIKFNANGILSSAFGNGGSFNFSMTELASLSSIYGGYNAANDRSYILFQAGNSNDITFVRINQNTLSTSETAKTPFNFAPNPAIDKISFSEEIRNVEVFSPTGSVIKIPFSKNEANVSNLQKGLYILKITDKKGNTISQKLIKE